MTLERLQPLAISVTTDEDGNTVIAVKGEIDMSNADQVWAALIEALATWTGSVVVDFAEVGFLDSQGINALLRVHKDCDFDAGRLSVRSPQPQVRKVLELTGLDMVLRIED